MSTYDHIVQQIDQQIARLEQVRDLLSARGGPPAEAPAPRRGRPRKAAEPEKAARQLSDEARARIAAAQKKRWAAQKQAAAE